MPRPRKCRRIGQQPAATVFKPEGGTRQCPAGLLRGVVLPLDGLEALRLVDALGLDQEAAAAQMGVSRATLGRILAQARCLVARALSAGWAIRIESAEQEHMISGPGEPGEIETQATDDETPMPCTRRPCCKRQRGRLHQMEDDHER
ncbi:DUF134 domain-containing protein [Megalodesulfovibrio paquesii]